MKKTWTDSEALDLISKVENAFEAHLATQAKPLNKSEAASETPVVEATSGEVNPNPEAAAAPAEATPVAMNKNEDECDYDSEDMEEMQKMYSSMTKAEKAAHYGALKKAMAGSEMAKSEGAEASAVKQVEAELAKAEVEALKASNEELRKSNEDLKKNLEGVIEALKSRFVKKPAAAPKQKAITELGVLAKGEGSESQEVEPSREQVLKTLTQKAKDPSLKKSDRDAINAYCYNRVNLSAVKHLLK